MGRTVLALGCIAALLVSCAAGHGRTWGRDGAAATYRQEVGPAARSVSAQEAASHQALHGGGNWRLGRTWPGEWNQMIMRALSKAEREAGRMLTRSEILNLVAENMKDYGIPMNFTLWRGR